MALAQSTFQTGPSDTLQAVDVYNKSGAAVINSIRDTTGYIKSLDANLARGSLSFNGISVSSILSGAQGQLKINPDALLRAAMGQSPALLSAYQSLSDARKVTFTALEDVISLVKVTKGAAQQFLNSAPINDLRAIVGMVMAVADGCPLFPNIIVEDISALTFLVSQLIKEATSFGMLGLYGAFSGCPKLSESSLRTVTRSLNDTLYSTFNNDLLLEIAQNGGGKFLLEADPNLFRSYLGKYQSQYPTQMSLWKAQQKTLADEFRKITDAFNLINPKWMLSTLSHDPTTIAAHVFDRASEDVLTLLRHAHMSAVPSPKAMLSRAASTGDWSQFNTAMVTFPMFHIRTIRRGEKVQGYDLLKQQLKQSMYFVKR